MDRMPFRRLASPRPILHRPDWPADLAEFYRTHEGIGLESSSDHAVRVCKLEEVVRIGWTDLRIDWDDEGWNRLAAFRIGVGSFFEQILYVLDAPSCPPGSIFAIGTNLIGCEGGNGPLRLDGSLVLAPNLPAWFTHLERWGGQEPILAGMGDLSPADWEKARQYYLAFNEQARDWEAPDAKG